MTMKVSMNAVSPSALELLAEQCGAADRIPEDIDPTRHALLFETAPAGHRHPLVPEHHVRCWWRVRTTAGKVRELYFDAPATVFEGIEWSPNVYRQAAPSTGLSAAVWDDWHDATGTIGLLEVALYAYVVFALGETSPPLHMHPFELARTGHMFRGALGAGRIDHALTNLHNRRFLDVEDDPEYGGHRLVSLGPRHHGDVVEPSDWSRGLAALA
jgi:hypothetical protein